VRMGMEVREGVHSLKYLRFSCVTCNKFFCPMARGCVTRSPTYTPYTHSSKWGKFFFKKKPGCGVSRCIGSA